ncbi:MFS transporter [Enterococcus faecalis]|uniref:MFS transporter n=1 Tax=Enterococcus faecalis TaxID=1351 RepID=UPI0001F0D172|nr:MFS transporter [Enterococcus faecalis]EFT95508.1 transporter, major facilitator family protein [Enterococcus faecalis TX0012]
MFFKSTNKVFVPRKITLMRAIGYGLPDIMGGGAFTIIGAWLLFYWTTYAGLSAVEAASILGISRIVDAVVSLLMGSITDNFYKTKLGAIFGRRHFFLLIGSPLMLTFILMWIERMSFIYYLFSYLLFEIVAAMVLIPWETLPTEMTNEFNQRTLFSTSRMFISSIGVFLATFIPGQLFKFLGEKSAWPFILNAFIFSIIYVVCIFIAYLVTWEKEVIKTEINNLGTPKLSLNRVLFNEVKDYLSTFKLRSFRKHLIIYLLSFTSKDVFNSVFAYFAVSSIMVSSTDAANVLSLSIIGPIVIILSGFLMVRFGPTWLYKVSYSSELLALCGFLYLYLAKPDNLIIFLYIFGLLYNFGLSILQYVPWNVFPLIPDLDEIVTSKRRAGLYAAVMTFVRKSTVAIATIIVGFLLDVGGYTKGQSIQTHATQNMITFILVGGTGSLLILALIEARTFHLNKVTHQTAYDLLTKLRNGESKENTDYKTIKVVEDLTGYKWDSIWRKSH